MAITDFLRRVVGKMFPKQNLERKLNVQIATSGVMDNAISLWLQMYENKPPWMGGEADTRTMNLPAAIAEEFSRLILTEFEFKLEGSTRADFLNDQFQNYLSNFDNIVEMWGALGGIAIKPYVSGSDPLTGKPDKIQLDFIQANRFYPTAFNSNKEITGAVFIDSKRVGDYLYTRLEHHNLEGDHYTVVNKAYRSERLNTMTTEDDQISVEHPFMQEVPLETIEEWAGLEPVTEMDGIERPFFLYVKVPRANNIDPHSKAHSDKQEFLWFMQGSSRKSRSSQWNGRYIHIHSSVHFIRKRILYRSHGCQLRKQAGRGDHSIPESEWSGC